MILKIKFNKYNLTTYIYKPNKIKKEEEKSNIKKMLVIYN